MSDSDTYNTIRVGPGFLGLLTIVFVILKVTGYISWSWWLVFSPILIGAGLAILIFGAILLAILIAVLVLHKRDKRR